MTRKEWSVGVAGVAVILAVLLIGDALFGPWGLSPCVVRDC